MRQGSQRRRFAFPIIGFTIFVCPPCPPFVWPSFIFTIFVCPFFGSPSVVFPFLLFGGELLTLSFQSSALSLFFRYHRIECLSFCFFGASFELRETFTYVLLVFETFT